MCGPPVWQHWTSRYCQHFSAPQGSFLSSSCHEGWVNRSILLCGYASDLLCSLLCWPPKLLKRETRQNTNKFNYRQWTSFFFFYQMVSAVADLSPHDIWKVQRKPPVVEWISTLGTIMDCFMFISWYGVQVSFPGHLITHWSVAVHPALPLLKSEELFSCLSSMFPSGFFSAAGRKGFCCTVRVNH